MYLTLVDLVLATSIIQSLGLAVFLLLPETFRLVSNRLLAASLITFAAGLGEFFLYSTGLALEDRKSTRLNSSHVRISYAVFCLKKKKNQKSTSAATITARITSHSAPISHTH